MAQQWYQNNMRYLQTVLREPDLVNYNPDAVIDYMQNVNANCLVINAGGVIDFFQNPLEMANVSSFLKGEILPGLCDAVHKAGMKVIGRVDFRGVEPRRYNLHPDWFGLDQNGRPKIGHYDGAQILRPCYNSYYANEHAEAFITYLLEHYDLDGIWENAIGFDYGPCYCKRCREAYRSQMGEELPPVPDPGYMKDIKILDLPQFKKYRKWKKGNADRHIERMRAAVKRFGEEKAYCAEIFDLYSEKFSKATGIDHENAKKSFDFMASCVFLNANHSPDQSRPYDIINNAASTVRYMRALAPDKQAVIVTGGNGTRWRYVMDPGLETRMWLWEIVSVGGSIWNCYFNGQTPASTLDRRAAFREKDAFTYLTENAQMIARSDPMADVLIYYSSSTRDAFCAMDEKIDDYGVYIKGIERVLLENHIPYSFLPDSELSMERLKTVKALLIPNGAYMSDEEVQVIREYVRQGGGLIASYRTSLFDKNGNQRSDFGLADVFGVSYTGMNMDTSNDSYQLINSINSELLRGFGDTELLINGGFTLLCRKNREDYDAVTTYIPTIPNQPPEYAWIPDMRTPYPIVVSGSFEKGRIVYFANGTDALCIRNGHEDYTELYKNAVDFVTGRDYTLESNAPRSVHINAVIDRKNPANMIISLVNVSGTSQRPLKEIIPVRDIQIRLPLKRKKLGNSKVLWGENVAIEAKEAELVITVDKLDEFASIQISLV